MTQWTEDSYVEQAVRRVDGERVGVVWDALERHRPRELVGHRGQGGQDVQQVERAGRQMFGSHCR